MVDSPETTDQPVESIGTILVRWRKRRRLTGQALGARVGMSQAKISRLENGVVAAEPSDVRLLAEELGMPAEQVERLVEMAEHAGNQLTEWTSAEHNLAERQDRLRKMEAAVDEHRVFQAAVVPGLMQTSEYARAVLSDIQQLVEDNADSAAEVAKAVSSRMQRNQILLDVDQEFHFIITEEVLRTHMAGPADMIAQIDRMREVAAYPNVHLRIVKDGVRRPIAPYHGFYLAADREVLVDLFNASLRATGRKTVQAYRRVFDALEKVATPDIEDLLSRYKTHYARMLLSESVRS